MNRTSIEWCTHTVNPIRFRNKETGKVGHYCEKISPGCKNCYASRMQTGPYLSGLEFKAENRDKGEVFFDEAEGFPYGSHDDQVDAVSGAYAALLQRKQVPHVAPVSVTGPSKWR